MTAPFSSIVPSRAKIMSRSTEKRFLATSCAIGILGAGVVLASQARACDYPPAKGDPVITKGAFAHAVVNVAVAPGQPELALTYTVGPSGLGAIIYDFASATTDQTLTVFAEFNTGPASGTVDLLSLYSGSDAFFGNTGGFTPYVAPGIWTLDQINIYDNADHCTYYLGGSVINAIIPHPSITVVNHVAPDTTPPTVSAAEILTPTIKLSAAHPFLRVNMTVADNLSGVQFAGATFTNAAQTFTIDTYPNAVAPVQSGIMQSGDELDSSTPPGTYSATQIEACDVAGNCFVLGQGTELANIFGGKTSFTVTK
jgi:hypothetical protein